MLIFLFEVIATANAIKVPPIVNLIKSSTERTPTSPKINKEKNTARGTTALLNAARVPGLHSTAPLFQRKKPKPEAKKPK